MFAFDHDEAAPAFTSPLAKDPSATDAGMIPTGMPDALQIQNDTTAPESRHNPAAPSTGRVKDANGLTPSAELKSRAAKKKQRKAIKSAAPADNVMRGFHTPVMSGGEESDSSPVSTPMLRSGSRDTPSSLSGSPALRPSNLTRALSNLKLNSAALDTGSTSPASRTELSNDSSSENGAASPPSEKVGSEVPLGRDFASRDSRPRALFGAVEGGLRHDSPHRKMSAADFEPLKCLGKGAFGTVILVKQHSTGRLFAQKQLKKASVTVQQRLIEQTKNERAILESVKRHPFVVKLFYAFQDRQKLYLILEYAQGGELFHHLALERTFTEEVAAFYMAEMVLALDHLHRTLGVVYRDLKPENCLLDAEGHLLLTDFGLSKVNAEDPLSDGTDSQCNSVVGTIDYMAPEAVQGKPYGPAVDWWSLGALGYDLLTGAPPFSSNNYTKTQQKIVHGKVTPPYYLSPDAKDLLVRLLRKEPHKRLGSNMPKDLTTIKNHRFFRKIDWKALAKRDVLAPIQPIITDPAAAENFDAEFTELAMSPLETFAGKGRNVVLDDEKQPNGGEAHDPLSPDDAFGGFSYVASRSLLDCE